TGWCWPPPLRDWASVSRATAITTRTTTTVAMQRVIDTVPVNLAVHTKRRQILCEQRLLRPFVRPRILQQFRAIRSRQFRSSGSGDLVMGKYRRKEYVAVGGVANEIRVHNRQRLTKCRGHHVRDRQPSAELVIGRTLRIRRLQDGHHGVGLTAAHPGIRKQRVRNGRTLFAPERHLPDTGCVAILAARGEAGPEEGARGIEPPPRTGGDVQLRGSLVDLPLRVEVEPFEERGRLLIARRQRFECRRSVTACARFSQGALE